MNVLNPEPRRKRKQSIDIGLDVIAFHMKLGETLTLDDIAEICECSPSNIERIERKALRKIRKYIMENYGLNFDQLQQNRFLDIV